MAYCKDCGEKIDSKNLHCPKCGKRIKKMKITVGRVILLSLLIVVLIALALVLIYEPDLRLPSSDKKEEVFTTPNVETQGCINECASSGCIPDEQGRPEFITCYDTDGDDCLNKVHMAFCGGPSPYCKTRYWCITGGENGDIMLFKDYGDFKVNDVYYEGDKRCVVSKVLQGYSIASCFNSPL